MRKTPLYSRSPAAPPRAGSAAGARPAGRVEGSARPPAAPPSPPPGRVPTRERVSVPLAQRAARASAAARGAFGRGGPLGWVAIGVVVATLAAMGVMSRGATGLRITQKDIDKAVLHTLTTQPLPSIASRAHEVVRRSVVRVESLGPGKDGAEEETVGVGTGVVITEQGAILTNLHVVNAAPKLRVTFEDGTQSEAFVTGTRPEHDLAVLRARLLPDDLQPATLASTGGLMPGDVVVAVGYPFGIGPSVSAGVVSGLGREFESKDGGRTLTNLIQFDAAANPGNSGGPLVTQEGEVVGIVTGILNPTKDRVFIGIGFAVPIENAASAVGIHPF